MTLRAKSLATTGNVEVDEAHANAVLKRTFDIVISLTAIMLLLPIFVFISMTLLIKDRGPVLFGQRRVGRHGMPFTCWKFRTMTPDADARLQELLQSDPGARLEWEETQRLKNDPRIIPRVGHILRKTNLDELPQLINVLRGQMSLVGPKPVSVNELEHYFTDRNMYVKYRPGMTGLWRVYGLDHPFFAHRKSLSLKQAQLRQLAESDVGTVLKALSERPATRSDVDRFVEVLSDNSCTMISSDEQYEESLQQANAMLESSDGQDTSRINKHHLIEILQADFHYLKDWRLSHDIRILVRSLTGWLFRSEQRTVH